MLEIKVSVTVEGLTDLANALHRMADVKANACNALDTLPVAQAAEKTVVEAGQETKKQSKKKTAKVEEPAPVVPVTPDEVEVELEKPVADNASTVEEEPQAKPTQDAEAAKSNAAKLYKLSEAGASLLEAGKMQDLIALLHSFKVEAVTMLQPEQYDAFAQGLRGLGAEI